MTDEIIQIIMGMVSDKTLTHLASVNRRYKRLAADMVFDRSMNAWFEKHRLPVLVCPPGPTRGPVVSAGPTVEETVVCIHTQPSRRADAWRLIVTMRDKTTKFEGFVALKDRRALVFIVIDHSCYSLCHVDESVTNVFDLERKVSNWPTTRAAFRVNYKFTPMSTETDEKSEVLRWLYAHAAPSLCTTFKADDGQWEMHMPEGQFAVLLFNGDQTMDVWYNVVDATQIKSFGRIKALPMTIDNLEALKAGWADPRHVLFSFY